MQAAAANVTTLEVICPHGRKHSACVTCSPLESNIELAPRRRRYVTWPPKKRDGTMRAVPKDLGWVLK